ncbi:hypothetical protein GCM10009779_08610 [Polymorphospora rubra]
MSERTGPVRLPTVSTEAPGTRHSTSYGPIASIGVTPSKSRIAMRSPVAGPSVPVRRSAAAGAATPVAVSPAPIPAAAAARSAVRRLTSTVNIEYLLLLGIR